MTGFRCLSINTDFSNRKPAVKGDKLYPTVLKIASQGLSAPTSPSFIAIQEIGPITYKEVLSDVTAFNHKPVAALYEAKRELITL